METASIDFETRARTIKAAKISRVVLAACRETGLSIEAVEEADQTARDHAARLAGCHTPSQQTWTVVCTLVAEQLRDWT